jgi:hypothetical protein
MLLSKIHFLALYMVLAPYAVAACSSTLKPSYPAPIVSDGWQAQLIAQDLSKPRSILFDSSGNLLVVEAGSGIVSLTFRDEGSTCLEVSQKTYLVNSTAVKISLEISMNAVDLYSLITALPSPTMERLYMHLPPMQSFHGPTMRVPGQSEIQIEL